MREIPNGGGLATGQESGRSSLATDNQKAQQARMREGEQYL